jgi:rhamnulokinase
VIGGGSRNTLLNRFTANATGVPVVAGPSEATAIGNIMIQAGAAGVAGSPEQMRRLIASAVETQRYEPQSAERWNEAYARFVAIRAI